MGQETPHRDISTEYPVVQCCPDFIELEPSSLVQTRQPHTPEVMSIQEIENAITKLSPSDLAEFAAWFADYQHQQWDRQIERDLETGRLDRFLSEMEVEYKAGKAKPL